MPSLVLNQTEKPAGESGSPDGEPNPEPLATVDELPGAKSEEGKPEGRSKADEAALAERRRNEEKASLEDGRGFARWMAQQGNLEALRHGFDHGGLEHAVHDGWALAGAAHGGRVRVLEWLLREGVQLNLKAGMVVRCAAGGGHIRTLEWLEGKGVDIKRGGKEAVCRAAENGHKQTLKWLQARGLDPKAGGTEALALAAKNGHIEVLKWLHENGQSVMADHGEAGRIAAYAALEYGRIQVLDWLKAHGVNPAQLNPDEIQIALARGDQPLSEAWLNKHIKYRPEAARTHWLVDFFKGAAQKQARLSAKRASAKLASVAEQESGADKPKITEQTWMEEEDGPDAVSVPVTPSNLAQTAVTPAADLDR